MDDFFSIEILFTSFVNKRNCSFDNIKPKIKYNTAVNDAKLKYPDSYNMQDN